MLYSDMQKLYPGLVDILLKYILFTGCWILKNIKIPVIEEEN